MEKLGVPGVAVVTDVFAPLVNQHAQAFGLLGLEHFVLPHPVANRSATSVTELVEARLPALLGALCRQVRP